MEILEKQTVDFKPEAQKRVQIDGELKALRQSLRLVRHTEHGLNFVSDRTGLQYTWLSKFCNGHASCPSYVAIRLLQEHFISFPVQSA